MKFLVCIIAYFVTKFMLIKTEDTVITIKVLSTNSSCYVVSNYVLKEGRNFTLNVESNFVTMECIWVYPRKAEQSRIVDLQNLNDAKIIVSYYKDNSKLKITNTSQYETQFKISHTETAQMSAMGKWIFRFKVLNNFRNTQTVECSTLVEVLEDAGSGNITVIIGSVLGVIVLAQSAYIIYSKIKGCRKNRIMNRSETVEIIGSNNKKGIGKDVTHRPPLPLPLYAEIEEAKEKQMTSPGLPVPCAPPTPVTTLHFPTSPPCKLKNTNMQRNLSMKNAAMTSSCPPCTPVKPFIKLPYGIPMPHLPFPSASNRPSSPPRPLSPKPKKKEPYQHRPRIEWGDSSDEEWNDYDQLKPVHHYLK